MKIPDRHFLKFAGAEPARGMRKEQRLARGAVVTPVPYEKPPDSPDRPSNMDRKRLEAAASGLPEADNPSKIAEASWAFKPPIPEGQEEGVVRDSPDNPSAILKANGEARPPAETQGQPPDLDNPSAITKALGEFKPPLEDTGLSSPEGANVQAQALLPSLDADSPTAILASLGQHRAEEKTPPDRETDSPNAMLASLGPSDQAIKADAPSAILAAMGQDRPAEKPSQAIEADAPSAILASMGQARAGEKSLPGIEADAPSAILASMGQQRPKEMPALEPTVSDLPADSRPVPEAATGLIVRERA